MKLIMNTRVAVAILMATAMIFSSILLEPLQASATDEFAPGAPTNLTAVDVDNHIDVYWDAPVSTDTRVPLVAGYEIDWKLSSDLDYGAPSVTDSVAGHFEIPSLTPGFYDVRIRSVAASCGIGLDTCRSVAVVKTSVLVQNLFLAPRIPTNLTAVGNATSISVAWVAPLAAICGLGDLCDVPVAKYEIDWKLSSDSDYGAPSVIASGVRYFESPSLPVPTEAPGFYDVRIKAVAASCGIGLDTCRSVGVVIRSVEVGGSPEVAASPSVSFQKQTGQDFSRDPNLASNYLVWTDLEDSGRLTFTLKVDPHTTSWSASLYPITSAGSPLVTPDGQSPWFLTWSGNPSDNYRPDDYTHDVGTFCDGLAPDACPNIFQFELNTTIGDPETGAHSTTFIYLVRKPDPQTFILTYARDTSATLPADDPRWIQVVDSSSIGIANASWVTKVNPDVFWERPSSQDKYSNGRYFGGWCYTPSPEDMEDDCADPTDTMFSVYRDRVVYPFWVTDLEPTSISIGTQIFLRSAWQYDPVEKAIYLTVESPVGAGALTGVVSMVGPRGVKYDTDYFETLGGETMLRGFGSSYEFSSGCTGMVGFCVYELTGDIFVGGADLIDDYKIFLTAAPDSLELLRPLVSVDQDVEINSGVTQVANARSLSSFTADVFWSLTGNANFAIDEESGQITAVDQLGVGRYTFSIVASYEFSSDAWMDGPPVQMTVTVVERSQVGSAENTNLPPTNQTGAGQHLPKPGSKLQADLISKVSRSKLAVGGTAQFGVTGGEPGATRVFESKNTRICSINARGLVTAKSTGVCLISATATAQDPVFAPASAPLTKIVVLGSGLINNAKVTVFKGQVSIKASLLKSLAGKSVKLAIEVKRGGKWVLVPMRREVLSKSATATFKSFAKPRPGTRVVLTIGGRAVHALTL